MKEASVKNFQLVRTCFMIAAMQLGRLCVCHIFGAFSMGAERLLPIDITMS